MQEGLQNDKANIKHPTTIPKTILLKRKRSKHHIPDIIRAIARVHHKLKGPDIQRTKCLQLMKCKYSTYNNTSDIIDHIHTIYAPLKQAIQLHNNGRIQVEVIPIVISRIWNFHTRTLAEIAQLVSFKENSQDILIYKSLPHQAQIIAMSLHTHAQEWLTLMSKISRSNLT